MGSPELEALKAVLVSNNRYLGWCTIAVFVGLLVEYTILLWLKRKELSSGEIALTIIAGLAIAGGVYGEYHFGSAAARTAMQIESLSENRVAQLNREAGIARREAGEAIERAGRAVERAAIAERETARLNKVAEEERLARLKIEGQVGPRTISPEQAKLIISALTPFKGRILHLVRDFHDAGDQEIGGFYAQLVSVFEKAGIILRIYAIPSPPDGVAPGITFGISNGAEDFAMAVLNALTAAGLSSLQTSSMVSNLPAGELELLIGRKPVARIGDSRTIH